MKCVLERGTILIAILFAHFNERIKSNGISLNLQLCTFCLWKLQMREWTEALTFEIPVRHRSQSAATRNPWAHNDSTASLHKTINEWRLTINVSRVILVVLFLFHNAIHLYAHRYRKLLTDKAKNNREKNGKLSENKYSVANDWKIEWKLMIFSLFLHYGFSSIVQRKAIPVKYLARQRQFVRHRSIISPVAASHCELGRHCFNGHLIWFIIPKLSSRCMARSQLNIN